MELTENILKKLLHYNPETGVFIWLKSPTKSHPYLKGREAGSVNRRGYRRIKINGRGYYAHRLAFLFMTGEWPKTREIDHINKNPFDNKWANLRECTVSENQRNVKVRIDNTSGHKGICWHKKEKKWHSRITVNGIRKFLGSFPTLQEAVKARSQAELEFFGEFTPLNL